MNIVFLVVKILLIVQVFLFIIYIFNLDMKLIKALETPMYKYYDNLKKDKL